MVVRGPEAEEPPDETSMASSSVFGAQPGLSRPWGTCSKDQVTVVLQAAGSSPQEGAPGARHCARQCPSEAHPAVKHTVSHRKGLGTVSCHLLDSMLSRGETTPQSWPGPKACAVSPALPSPHTPLILETVVSSLTRNQISSLKSFLCLWPYWILQPLRKVLRETRKQNETGRWQPRPDYGCRRGYGRAVRSQP
ncbi:uncharacterized protein LOC104856036 isoform X2 [Fukomys damarensis]|uniref:uncharacterized protein LOC104856036 isoform X2 n=1 Tax=Fukomys damarensis TaxID=885580 RepID=UPI0014558A3A|nr:uncharacterized protein LOC104856036 isoform X2 [Fukomys damarensis]